MAVLVFDGVCLLCDGLVRFLLRHDRHGRLQFAALQGEPAQELLGRFGVRVPKGDPQTVYLVDDGRLYDRSAAILRTLRLLGIPWSLLYAGVVIPRPLRDLLYRFIARHRYRWFGRADACRRPTPAERARFLDA